MSLIKHVSSEQPIGTPFAFRRSDAIGEDGAQSASAATLPSRAPQDRAADRVSEAEALRSVIRDLSEQLERAKAQTVAASEDARAEGFAQGLREAATREEERLTLFSQALEDGLRSLNGRLERDRDIAIELTIATLNAILGDPRQHAALVTETARRWADTLKSSKILRVKVSGADFATPDAVSFLSKRIAGITVAVDEGLPSGACLFDLELGHVDASLDVQASAAAAFLLDHASAKDRAA